MWLGKNWSPLPKMAIQAPAIAFQVAGKQKWERKEMIIPCKDTFQKSKRTQLITHRWELSPKAILNSKEVLFQASLSQVEIRDCITDILIVKEKGHWERTTCICFNWQVPRKTSNQNMTLRSRMCVQVRSKFGLRLHWPNNFVVAGWEWKRGWR